MYEKRVARGAKWLDKVCPDWYTKVRTEWLSVDSDASCVVGQAMGDFQKVMDEKFLIPESLDGKKYFLHPGVYVGIAWAFAHGFLIGQGYCEPLWIAAWSKEIKKREEANRELYVPTAWEEEREAVPSQEVPLHVTQPRRHRGHQTLYELHDAQQRVSR